MSFFKLVHVAYEKVVYDCSSKSILFYHIHNPDIYAQLNFMRLAPEANWIMMVREPIQSCESWIRKEYLVGDYNTVVMRIVMLLFEIDNIKYLPLNKVFLLSLNRLKIVVFPAPV